MNDVTTVTLNSGVIAGTARHGDNIPIVMKDNKVLDSEVKEITDPWIII